MPYNLCRHVKANGTRCQAPALTGGVWCYFHVRLHERHAHYRLSDQTRGCLFNNNEIELTALEDHESVQVAISVVINALATGHLESRRATALLYGLQLASSNAGKIHKPFATEVVQIVEPCPNGLDLAEPEVVDPPEFRFDDDEDEDDDAPYDE